MKVAERATPPSQNEAIVIHLIFLTHTPPLVLRFLDGNSSLRPQLQYFLRHQPLKSVAKKQKKMMAGNIGYVKPEG